MKKTLQIIMLNSVIFAAITTMLSSEINFEEPNEIAYLGQMEERLIKAREKAKTDDEALKEFIRLFCSPGLGSSSTGMFIEIGKEISKTKNIGESEISYERYIRVMENMVREGLAVYNKNAEDFMADMDIYYCMLILSAVSEYDVLPLLKECLKSKYEIQRYSILMNYVWAKNEETLPFLRELVEEANLTDKNRTSVYDALVRFTSFNELKKMEIMTNEMTQSISETSIKQPVKIFFKSNPILYVFIIFVTFISSIVIWKIIKNNSSLTTNNN